MSNFFYFLFTVFLLELFSTELIKVFTWCLPSVWVPFYTVTAALPIWVNKFIIDIRDNYKNWFILLLWKSLQAYENLLLWGMFWPLFLIDDKWIDFFSGDSWWSWIFLSPSVPMRFPSSHDPFTYFPSW